MASLEAAPVRGWFCLRTRPKHEHIAAAHLRKIANVEVFLPRIRFQRHTRQGAAQVTEALFPNYLFAHFDLTAQLRVVQATNGVSGVVHFGQRWPVIEPTSIAALRQLVGDGELRTIPSTLQPGDAVTIVTGALQGWSAVSASGQNQPVESE